MKLLTWFVTGMIVFFPLNAVSQEKNSRLLKGSITVGELRKRSCTPHYDSGYQDITKGTKITIRNGEGNIIGTTQLEDGSHSMPDESRMGFCEYPFQVEVPITDFYEIDMGSRGSIVT